MSGMKECIRCGRKIDAHARICPYCNWDQMNPVPAQEKAPAIEVEPYIPPPERSWRKPVLGLIGIALAILIAGLAIAERLRDTGPQVAPLTEQQAEQQKLLQKEAQAGPAKPTQHATVTLVPDNSPAPSIEQQTATAPAATTAPAPAGPADTTASTATQYSQTPPPDQSAKKKMDALVDPRTLTGPAYAQANPQLPPRPRSRVPSSGAATANAIRTSAVPEYQPIPELSVRQDATARLELKVGADGHVKSVNVRDAAPVDMGRLIESVQSWRFRPATENGVPVPSSFTVELSFHASE